MATDEEAKVQEEVDAASVYAKLARSERDPKLAEVLERLSGCASAQAELARRRLGRREAAAAPSPKAKLLAAIGRGFGSGRVLKRLAETSGAVRAAQQAAKAAGGLSGESLTKVEGRGGGGGNALRAAILGANDGLVSNLSLVMGVAGASVASRTILLTGLAGLVAGACSMGMGEWLSVNSAREMNARQVKREAAELRAHPDREKEDLILIYRAKGLDETSAKALVNKLFRSQSAAIDTLAREELGVDPEGLGGSAWAAAASSFFLFATGAIFPVIPFIFTGSWRAILASVVLSAAALASIGAATSLFTGRSWAFSAGRQLLIGLAAAGVTFGVGRLIGATLS
ncbi:MAG: VIT1/CCC1 transporter family protein [Caulobacteraceae bacterium]